MKQTLRQRSGREREQRGEVGEGKIGHSNQIICSHKQYMQSVMLRFLLTADSQKGESVTLKSKVGDGSVILESKGAKLRDCNRQRGCICIFQKRFRLQREVRVSFILLSSFSRNLPHFSSSFLPLYHNLPSTLSLSLRLSDLRNEGRGP